MVVLMVLQPIVIMASGQVDGLNFALQYQGNNESAGSGEAMSSEVANCQKENGDGFGISSSYDFDFGLSLVPPLIRPFQ